MSEDLYLDLPMEFRISLPLTLHVESTTGKTVDLDCPTVEWRKHTKESAGLMGGFLHVDTGSIWGAGERINLWKWELTGADGTVVCSGQESSDRLVRCGDAIALDLVICGE